MSAEGVRITSYSADPGSTEAGSPVGASFARGTSIDIGREGDVPAGIDPQDLGVSRVALTVRAEKRGWRIEAGNKRGVVVHPWAQSPTLLQPGAHLTRRWPRIAVRIVGAGSHHHWVLLEDDDIMVGALSDLAASAPGRTFVSEPPDPLTPDQMDPVRTVFSEHLDWPPRTEPRPFALASAARRLGVSQTAITDRLQRVQNRAYQLGAHTQTGVTDPSYFYVLVAHGYIQPPW